MNFKNFVILINLSLLVFSFEAISETNSDTAIPLNEGTKKIGSFDNWSVYAKSKSLCYMISQPKKSEGNYKLRGRVRIVIYRNNYESQNKNAVGIDFGYSLLWCIIFSIIATSYLQELSSRLGIISRLGLGDIFKSNVNSSVKNIFFVLV